MLTDSNSSMTNSTLVVELRKFKSSQLASEETLFFRADVYFDGKKVGTAENDGRGGSTNVHFNNQADYQRLNEFVATLPPLTFPDGGTLKQDSDTFISQLAEDLEQAKFAKKEQAQRQRFADKASVAGQKAYFVKVSPEKAYLYNLNPTSDIKKVVAQLAAKNKVSPESITVETLN